MGSLSTWVANLLIYGVVGLFVFYFAGWSWPVGLALGLALGIVLSLINSRKRAD